VTTTVRELLASVTRTIEQAAPNPMLPVEAAAAVGHCGRALRDLAFEGVDAFGTRGMHASVIALADSCDRVAATWPSGTGRAELLAGAGADAITQISGQLPPSSRWALAVELAAVARHCGRHARSFPPVAQAPQLAEVHAAAAAVVQVATTYPPTPRGRVALDHAVPSLRPSPELAGIAAAADAAPALAAALHAQVARGVLSMSELLASARTAAVIARSGVAFAAAIAGPDKALRPWAAAPKAWRAVHGSCAPFDDGTKLRPPTRSEVLVWAAHIETSLYNASRATPRELAATATAMRAIGNQLPDLAEDLDRAVRRWSAGNHLLARQHRLSNFEDEHLDAAQPHAVVFARGSDFGDLTAALWDARRLSISLAGELDRSSATVGRQPQPDLAARYVAASDLAGHRAMHTHAKRAHDRAAATTGSRQWAYAPRPRRAR
jgi:hypothetical protein